MSRKKIAVITARADDNEQKAILVGIAEAAFRKNADVAVFSNIYNHWMVDEILNFENVIYDFFRPELFDGVIVTAEAFMDLTVLDTVFERIKAAGIPAVIIDGEVEGFCCIRTDDEADLEQLAEHLISIHGLTDIAILTGSPDNQVSHRRVLGCRKAFEKHGIPLDESKIYFGDFWSDSGEQLAKRYISGELPMPQAVICTNDHMAYGLCDALTAAGIEIPDKITVTGYDHIGERLYHYPILTTYQRNRWQMGMNAVYRLFSAEEAEEAKQDRLICGNTCTCGVKSSQLNEEIRAVRVGQYHNVMNSVAQFASRLTLCRTLAEYTAVLGEFFYLLHDVSGMYLCLDREWNSAGYAGEEFLCCAIGKDDVSEAPVRFEKNILFPELMAERSKPMVYYFSPLCFQTRLFGYTVLAYEYPQGYDFSFRDWNKTVANTLEFLRMKNDIHYLKQCQRISTLYDSLTGFYNLHEFRQIVESVGTERPGNCIIQAVKMNFFSDGEYLYGENYRSDIISAVAQAIKQSCKNKEICCRAGEDMFLILGRAETEDLFAKKRKAMIHHALCGRYDENQVLIAYEFYRGRADGLAVDRLCEQARQTAKELWDELLQRKELPHYKVLLEIRSSVQASPHNAPSIEELSRRLCVSDGYFRAIYKKCFGISYVQDCINARILLAEYLLCTTAMSIYAIAMRCGYTDEKYFARQFRQCIGCSPVQYRQETHADLRTKEKTAKIL
ncbi:MAG: substrate-binding domain-containing protein [Lachnospiraceae bacterium]|nr:substrate-binding domain-containing protein [Lachnospiraceae bacterium]